MQKIRHYLSQRLQDESSLLYILNLAAPMIVTFITFTLMQFVDRLMVSRIGTDAFAAVMPAGIVSFVPASFGMGIIIALNTFVSQYYGRGEKQKCTEFTWQMMYMGSVYFLLVLALVLPLAHLIFSRIMQHPEEIIPMEVTYFRIMMYAHVPAMLIWCCNNFFVGIHRPRFMMFVALIGHPINVLVNYILIFGKFGFPAMGIAGAAWGTFTGIAVEAVFLMAIFLSPAINREYLSRTMPRIDLAKMKALLKIGLPSGLTFMINIAFFGLILAYLIGRFGKEALAATTAVLTCTNMALMPIIGVAKALTTAVGKSIGNFKKDLAIEQTRVCFRFALFYTCATGLTFLFFRESLMQLWSEDNTVIQMGVDIFIIAVLFQFFDVLMVIYGGMLRGAGDTLWLAAVSGSGSILVMGIGGFLLVEFVPQLGAIGPWIAATANMFAVSLANRWRFKSNLWMKIDLFKTPAPVAAEPLPE